MCTSDNSTASLNMSLPQVPCSRSRSMIYQKLSQESHVRRMMVARQKDDRESPSFILPSNHPNAELKVKDIPLTKLKFGRRHSKSAEEFGGISRQNDDIAPSGRKCWSSANSSALTNKCDFLKQNKCPALQERIKASSSCEKDGIAEINSDDHTSPALSKVIPGKTRKQISIFSKKATASAKTTHCGGYQKQTKTDADTISKPIGPIQYPKMNASIQINSPNHSSADNGDKACSGKGASNNVSDCFSIEEISETECSNILLNEKPESAGDVQTSNHATKPQQVISSRHSRKNDSNSIKRSKSKEANLIIENKVELKETTEVKLPANATRCKSELKKKTKSKRKFNVKTTKLNKKISGVVKDGDAARKVIKRKTSSNSFPKTAVSSLNDKTNSPIPRLPTMSLDSLDDQKKTLDLQESDINYGKEKGQCLLHEMVPTPSKESFENTSITKTKSRQIAKKKRLPPRIPMALSRIEKTKRISHDLTSMDSLDDLNQILDTRYAGLTLAEVQSPSGIVTKEVGFGASKEAMPNVHGNKPTAKTKSRQTAEKKRLPSKVPMALSRIEGTKRISHELLSIDSLDDLNKILDSSYGDHTLAKVQSPSGVVTNEDEVDLGVPKEESQPNASSEKENSRQNVSEKRTSRLSVMTENRRTSEKTSSGLENPNTPSDDSGETAKEDQFEASSFSSQEDLDFKEAGSSVSRGIGRKKQIVRPSRSRSSVKNVNKKLAAKSHEKDNSSLSLPLSFKSGGLDRLKNRKSVINTEKLLGKFDESVNGIEFFDSPIRKFMDEINSSLFDSESDE